VKLGKRRPRFPGSIHPRDGMRHRLLKGFYVQKKKT
jgi:hypothetical protein